MTNPVRSALLFGAALIVTNIAPAQAGSNSDSMVTAATVSLPPLAIDELLDPYHQPELADPDGESPAEELTAPAIDAPVETAPAAVVEPAVAPGADLGALVASLRGSDPGSRELECLATGIYFESKGESLAGQLAVGQVIANRAASGRFPSSYCGVLFQRSQFSFIRGKSLPSTPRASHHWHNAVAIAKIVDRGLKQSSVGKALFFHARYVSPGWRLKRVASIGNHVFYR
jgi:spore germination cell wall hydrolase CwlJ-like protein